MVDVEFLRNHIDFTNVSPVVSKEQIKDFCNKAIQYKVKTIYVSQIFTRFACSLVNKHDIDVGTTAGFPYGSIPVHIKLAEIDYASQEGAKWVDVVLNISAIKSGQWDDVEKEIQAIAGKTKDRQVGLKLIIQAPDLTENEIRKVTSIADSNSVDFIKTATGVINQVRIEHVKLIKPLLKNSKLKTAGNIQNLREALEFFGLGSDTIGSSNGFLILEEAIRHGL